MSLLVTQYTANRPKPEYRQYVFGMPWILGESKGETLAQTGDRAASRSG
jgi:hypothetical protein